MAVRDNSLPENYQPHDIAEDVLRDRLESVGYDVVDHGVDDRHGEARFGHGPDQAVKDGDTLLGYVEVKSKRLGKENADYDGSEWFGVLNRRHYQEYLDVASTVEVPVYLYFAIVDMDCGMVVRDGFVEVDGQKQITETFTSKGNMVIRLDVTEVRNFTWLYYQLETTDGVEITEVDFP